MHRFAENLDDSSKKRNLRGQKFNGMSSKFVAPLHERRFCCKLRSLKPILLIIICGTFLTFIFAPVTHNERSPHSSRSRLVDVGWKMMWERAAADSRYPSDLNINWTQVSRVIKKLNGRRRELRVGLLNFNITEINSWQQLLPRAELHTPQLSCARANLTWDDLYPEWIDEEAEFGVPSCPDLPDPALAALSAFDLIAAKLPCNRTLKNWSRDVARLHLQLAAARLATRSGHGSQLPAHVLLLTDCFPIPNLFSCKNRVAREGNAWLYNPDPIDLKESLRLPVGSCKLSVPLKSGRGRSSSEESGGRRQQEAYATILHSAHVYVCGAIVAAQSIRLAGSARDLVILVDETISRHHRDGLEEAGWKVRMIERIRNPKAERDAYNEWNYSKFRLWQLTDYDKIIFIDADLLILRNIDFLFTAPEIAAIGNNGTLFNSGVMVVEPSNCTFEMLMEHVSEIESYNGGDQGYLNEIFTWWHRIPKRANFLKHFWEGDEEAIRREKVRLFGASPPELYVLHYLGLKPWLCFRDYDCNWNVDILQEFASDAAHATWWRVHDTMPESLQKHCLLRSKQKAALEWDRRQAEKAKYSDGHWKRNITDKRLHICFEEFCFWESMLWHWGETNSTTPNNAAP